MNHNATYTQEYLDIVSDLDGDVKGKRDARTYMEQSSAIYHGVVVDPSFVPRFFDQESYNYLEYVATTSYRILIKVMDEYLNNPAFRELFSFDKRLEELILLPRNYDALLPFARVDIFFDEDTMSARFCEFNGDGSSGMNENREIGNALRQTASLQEFARRHKLCSCDESLFESWVQEFLAIYDTYRFKKEHPHVAIIDFLENAITEEFKIFARLFERFGVECSVYDVRDLVYENGTLIGKKAFFGRDNAVIDAAWRRCVTNDIIDNWEASSPLIDAVRDEKLALIGSFAGHLVHDKQIFQVLHLDEMKYILSAEELTFIKETIPFTSLFSSDRINITEMKRNKDKWIIKPLDAYGSKDVYAGLAYDNEQWYTIVERYVDARAGMPFIAQQYCTPFRTLALPLRGHESDLTAAPQSYTNLSGLYLYNGRFAGVFSRLGPQPIISKKTQGITAVTLWTDTKLNH